MRKQTLHWQSTKIATAQAAARMMVQQKIRGNKIVIVSSFMGLTGFAGYSPYAPAKYALRGELSIFGCEGPAGHVTEATLCRDA